MSAGCFGEVSEGGWLLYLKVAAKGKKHLRTESTYFHARVVFDT